MRNSCSGSFFCFPITATRLFWINRNHLRKKVPCLVMKLALIAFEADDVLRGSLVPEADDVLHHPLGVWPPVDVIAHKDQLIAVQIRLELVHKPLQKVQVAMNIANSVNVGHS